MNENNTAHQLKEALDAEYQLYVDILELSKKQVDLIRSDEPDAEKIASLMDQKIQVKNKIEIAEEQNRNIKNVWEQVYQSHSDKDRESVKKSRDQLMVVLEALQRLEEQVSEYLQTTEHEISEELRNIYRSRSVNRAYFNAEKNPPQYVNRLSK